MFANEIKPVVWHRFCIRGATLLLIFWAAEGTLISAAQSQSTQQQPTSRLLLSGEVVDGLGKPVSNALVHLQRPDGIEASTTTDASGNFSFKALGPDNYALTAEKSHVQSASITVQLPGPAVREIRIVLQSPHMDSTSTSPGETIEFSDKPSFTVAGVTDWTAVGGHGSDATLRASEDLTRKTLALKVEGTNQSGLPAKDQNNGEAEEKKLHAAVIANPRSYSANRDLGSYYLRAANYGQALPLLLSAADLNQGGATDEFNLALACQGIGDLQAAHKHVERALTQKDTADSHRLLGELNEKLGDPLSAVQQEERATRMEPSEENYFVWGSELLAHRAIWQAAEVFAKGAKMHPSSARMKTGWGAALFAGARYDEAAERLCDASDLDPTNPEPYLFLGKISLASPTSPQCVQQKLARFVQLRPNEADANYFYAMFLLKEDSSSNLQRVESLLQKVVVSDPRYSEAYLQLGVISFTQQAYSEAIDFFTKAINADPLQAEAHYRLGMAYDRTGKVERAQQEFKLHDQLAKAQASEVEQQRRQVKQFLVVLQGKSADSATP